MQNPYPRSNALTLPLSVLAGGGGSGAVWVCVVCLFWAGGGRAVRLREAGAAVVWTKRPSCLGEKSSEEKALVCQSIFFNVFPLFLVFRAWLVFL